MTSRKMLLLGAAGAALLGSGCNTAPAAAEPDGALLFTNYCQPCHTAEGTGTAEVAAPNIAGLPQWYVERQVHNFRVGIRGQHFDDIAGMRMRPMSLTLTTDAEVTAVSAYVASLPIVQPPITLEGGDPEVGKVYFATCQACHGPTGDGNETLNAPPLSHANDWYMLTQLKNIKGGVRASDPRDTMGAQMKPMAMTLPDEQAMKDVIAYIQTL